jgi:hypothetical protein
VLFSACILIGKPGSFFFSFLLPKVLIDTSVKNAYFFRTLLPLQTSWIFGYQSTCGWTLPHPTPNVFLGFDFHLLVGPRKNRISFKKRTLDVCVLCKSTKRITEQSSTNALSGDNLLNTKLGICVCDGIKASNTKHQG